MAYEVQFCLLFLRYFVCGRKTAVILCITQIELTEYCFAASTVKHSAHVEQK